MAHAIAEGIMSEDVEVKMYFMHDDDKSDAVTDVLDSKAIFVGAPTMMNNPFPGIGDVMYYPSVLAWRIPGTGEPGGQPSMGSHRVGHDTTEVT